MPLGPNPWLAVFLAVASCASAHPRTNTSSIDRRQHVGYREEIIVIHQGGPTTRRTIDPNTGGAVETDQMEATDLSGCPISFSRAQSGKAYDFAGELYFLDDVGRPAWAETTLPPIVRDDARDKGCQRDVGRWGDAEHPEDDFDGGHLIAHQLGGWGGRANLVPQSSNFNRGVWAQLENSVARCTDLADGALRIRVQVEYVSYDTLVPSAFTMLLQEVATGESVTARFENAPYGGPEGEAERARAVTWLQTLGCH